MNSDTIIYHNPECGTSRNALAMIRNAGIEPVIVAYLETPPSRAELEELIVAVGLTVREALRTSAPPYAELELDDEDLGDNALLGVMVDKPILINRPFVRTALGVRLCRPSERVLEILPTPQSGPFTKEDGEVVIPAGPVTWTH